MPNETDLNAGAARDGDAEAFARLYERLLPSIYNWARHKIRGHIKRHVEPEDIVQETWWRAMEGFSRFDHERGGFRRWVFGIATNVYVDAIQRCYTRRASMGEDRKALISTLPPEASAQLTSITTRLARREDVRRLGEWIAQLSAEEQVLFVRCGLEGQPIADVLERVPGSEAAVQKRWERLRERIGDHPAWREFIEVG